MKIAFFTDTFCPTINGVVTCVIDYANTLVEAKHKVLIVAPRNKDYKAEDWGVDPRVEIYWLPSVNFRFYPNMRMGLLSPRLVNKFRSFSPDIVHTFTPFSVGLQGLFLAKQMKVRVVASHLTNYTDNETLKSVGWFSDSMARTALHGAGSLIRSFLNQHDAITVPTEDTRNDLLEMGVTQSISVFPMPVPISSLRGSRVRGLKMRKNLGIKKALLFAGRLSGEKNIHFLLQSFAQLLKINQTLRCVIIGDGPDRPRLFQIANELQISQSIIWTGAIPHEQLINGGYYYLGDIFVTFSEFETQGLSTVEAMASGLAVVGVDARATTEVIGTHGTLISPGDVTDATEKIGQLIQNKRKLRAHKKLSILRSKDFSEAKSRRKLFSFYHAQVYAGK